MTSVEQTGKTIDEATQKALKQLGVIEDDVDVEILEEGARGFLGLGQSPAKVRVSLKQRPRFEAAPEPPQRERRPRQRQAPREEQPVREQQSPREERPPRQRPPRQERPAREQQAPREEPVRDQQAPREERPPRQRPPRQERPARQPQAPREEQPVRDQQAPREERPPRQRPPRQRPAPKDRPEPQPAAPEPISAAPIAASSAPIAPVAAIPMEEILKQAAEISREALQHIADGIEDGAKASVKSTEDNQVVLEILSSEPATIIGKHGQTIDAIQYLVGVMTNKRLPEKVRVVVDVEGYRSKREEALTNQAHFLASKVKETGEEAVLEPLHANERRIIHSALADDPDVYTYSEGEEPDRHIVISPKK